MPILSFKKKKIKHSNSCSCPNHEDRYVTAFHSGSEDPPYFKRFSMSMFTFTKDEEVLQNEVSRNEGCFIGMHQTAALLFAKSVNGLSAMCFGRLVTGYR